jgi:hypothetical protein
VTMTVATTDADAEVVVTGLHDATTPSSASSYGHTTVTMSGHDVVSASIDTRLVPVLRVKYTNSSGVASDVTVRCVYETSESLPRFFRWRITDNGGATDVQAAGFHFLANLEDQGYDGLLNVVTAFVGSTIPVGSASPTTTLVDGSTSTTWSDPVGVSTILFEYVVGQRVDGYQWTTGSGGVDTDPRSWTFSSSHDGVSWKTLHVVVGYTPPTGRGELSDKFAWGVYNTARRM